MQIPEQLLNSTSFPEVLKKDWIFDENPSDETHEVSEENTVLLNSTQIMELELETTESPSTLSDYALLELQNSNWS